MSQIQYIFKTMSWLMVSQIIASVCAFVWTILIARYLGVDGNGIIGFAISFSTIIAITMDFGISSHIVRHVSTNSDSVSKYLGNAIPLKSFFSIGTLLISLIILILMHCSELVITITLLFLIERIFMSMSGLLNGVFQAVGNGKYQAICSIIQNILLLIFILISVYADFGIYGISISYTLANIIVTILLYIFLIKKVALPKFELDKSFCKMITLASIPFALTSFFYAIYYSIDMVMLSSMVGDYANGIYNASYKLISVLTLFYSIYGAVVFPVMSRLFKNDERLLVMSFEKSIKYLLMIIIPIAFATVFYSIPLVDFFYGTQYVEAGQPLAILIWTVCLLFINGACTNLLNASHKERFVTVTYVVAAIFNVILNLILIPNYSYNGAAIATVLSDLLIACILFYMIYKIDKLPSKNIIFDVIKIIIGSSILYYILIFLNISMWLAIPVSIAIYLVIMLVIRIFDDDDKFIIKDILGKS